MNKTTQAATSSAWTVLTSDTNLCPVGGTATISPGNSSNSQNVNVTAPGGTTKGWWSLSFTNGSVTNTSGNLQMQIIESQHLTYDGSALIYSLFVPLNSNNNGSQPGVAAFSETSAGTALSPPTGITLNSFSGTYSLSWVDNCPSGWNGGSVSVTDINTTNNTATVTFPTSSGTASATATFDATNGVLYGSLPSSVGSGSFEMSYLTVNSTTYIFGAMVLTGDPGPTQTVGVFGAEADPEDPEETGTR